MLSINKFKKYMLDKRRLIGIKRHKKYYIHKDHHKVNSLGSQTKTIGLYRQNISYRMGAAWILNNK